MSGASRVLLETRASLLAVYSLEQVLDIVLTKCIETFAADGALVSLPGAAEEPQVVCALGVASPLQGDLLPQVFHQTSLLEGKLLADVNLDPHCRCAAGMQVDALLGETERVTFCLLKQQGVFTDADLGLFCQLVDTAVLAIEGAQLYTTLQRRNAQWELLNEIGRSIASTLDMDALFKTIHQQVGRVMSTDAFVIGLYDQGRDMLSLRYLYDDGTWYPPMERKLGGGPLARSIRTRQPVIWYENIAHDPNVTVIGEERNAINSGAAVPILIGERLIGVLSAQSHTPHAYGEEQVHLLTTVASQAAVAIHNARLHERVRRLSYTDGLTGLANARRFYIELENYLRRAKRQGDKVGLLMIDSDSLKQINDRFGHRAGDRHLQALANIITANVREDDLAVRYAGDEFLVVLPDADRAGAKAVAERICASVANHRMRIQETLVVATVSIGVAVYPDDAVTAEGLFRAADLAMYRAKHGGRNRVALGVVAL